MSLEQSKKLKYDAQGNIIVAENVPVILVGNINPFIEETTEIVENVETIEAENGKTENTS